MASGDFSWIEAFGKIALKLQDFNDKQERLIETLSGIGVENGLTDKDLEGNSIPLEEVDPFTFLALATKFSQAENSKYIGKLFKLWNIDQKAPKAFDGVPSVQSQSAWYFAYKSEREKEDVTALWELFLAASQRLNVSDSGKFGAVFDTALQIKYTGFTSITQGLFKFFPMHFLPIDNQTKPYLKELGISLPNENWGSYYQCLQEVQHKIHQPFHQISFDAWSSNTLSNESASDVLVNEFGFELFENTKKVKQFRNKTNTFEIAIMSENIAPTFFMEKRELPVSFKTKDYPLDGNRNSNLKSKLKKGFQRMQLKLKSPKELRQLLSIVSDSSKNEAKKEMSTDVENKQKLVLSNGLNTILFGPPGTGKTYTTIEKAVQIIDTDFVPAPNNQNTVDWDNWRARLKSRYDELVAEKRIQFCTFHQSFSYEDFIEGIRPEQDEAGNLTYPVQYGVFRDMVIEAQAGKISLATTNYEPTNIWKMSLGDTLGDEGNIYDRCIEKSYVLLGYGDDLNFSSCSDRNDVYKVFVDNGDTFGRQEYPVTAVHSFVNRMQIGDLIIVSDGNLKFRAVAEVTDDYCLLSADDKASYRQCRKVKWLFESPESLPYKYIMNKRFSQMTLYAPSQNALNKERLFNLIETKKSGPAVNGEARPYVLIIDEINRGNISRIFGELITLIEDDKREGMQNEQSIILPYSKDAFVVPDNLYILGTMNTADRSLSGIDIALRRRFQFEEMMPNPSLLHDKVIQGVNLSQMLIAMNERIEVLLGRDYMIGHSYFINLGNGDDLEQLSKVFANKIIPLLQEYFFEDWERIQWVLNDHRKTFPLRFIQRSAEIKNGKEISDLFGEVDELSEDQDRRWNLNNQAFDTPSSYKQIYETDSKGMERQDGQNA